MNPLLQSDDSYNDILDRSGRNDSNRYFLSRLEKTLPHHEWKAISSWISTFYGYQQNWLMDQNRRAVLISSRQTGKSHTSAALAVLWALGGEKVALVSIGQKEADRLLEYAKAHVKVLAQLGSKWAITTRDNASRLEIKSGGQINSLPSTGPRGDSANVILDEVAYYENTDKVLDASTAATTHNNYRVRIISTPNGVGNRFYDICKNHKKLGYSYHSYNIEQAIADGLRVKIEDCLADAHGDRRLFNQRYMCSFLDNEYQYIPSEYIDDCATDDLPKVDNDHFYGGLDIGRSNDLTVLASIQRCGKINGKQQWCLRNIDKRKRTKADDLKKMVAAGFEKFHYKKLVIDSTGIGAFPAEELVKIHGYGKVEPVHFTMQVKEELATSLFVAFQQRRIIIPDTKLSGTDPEDVRLLKEDVASIQRMVNENTGNVKYDAPSTATGHADRAWALAMAIHAAMNANTYARLPF